MIGTPTFMRLHYWVYIYLDSTCPDLSLTGILDQEHRLYVILQICTAPTILVCKCNLGFSYNV